MARRNAYWRIFWIVPLGLVLLSLALILLIDRPIGQRFLLSRLDSFSFASGLTIKASRVDGSIYGKFRVHNLRIGDPKGDFLVVPDAEIDWRPSDLWANQLTIRSAHAAVINLQRLPQLRPTDDARILPDMDIMIGRLVIDQLVIAAKIAGKAQVLNVHTRADIHQGRAMIDLNAKSITSADTLMVKLDAEPDRDQFEIAGKLEAPVDGALAQLIGSQLPISAQLSGSGKWSAWQGQLQANSGGQALATLSLILKAGRFSVNGNLRPAAFLTGLGARLTAPAIEVDFSSDFSVSAAPTQFRLASSALTVEGHGQLGFSAERFNNFHIDARLLQPAALFSKLAGRDIRLTASLAGQFRRPLIDYELTAATLRYANIEISQLRALGVAEVLTGEVKIPLTATAARITGYGRIQDEWLTNVRLSGPLRLIDGLVTSDALVAQTALLHGQGSAVLALASSELTVKFNAQLPAYAIGDVGTANLSATGQMVSSPRVFEAHGSVYAEMLRIDNAGARTLLGGLPVVESLFATTPDQSIALREVRLKSPLLTLTGNGISTGNGAVALAATGNSGDFGPVALAIGGSIDAPEIDLRLSSPGLGLNLTNVVAHISPEKDGWNFVATSSSSLGLIRTSGAVATSSGPLKIDINRLSAAGMAAQGSISQTASGPFDGRFGIAGSGISGTLFLSAEADVQRADVMLRANGARIATAVPITIKQGMFDGVMRWPNDNAGPTIAGSFDLADARRGEQRLIAGHGSIDFHDGAGFAKLSGNGFAGLPVTVVGQMNFTQKAAQLSGEVGVDGRQFKLAAPAQFTRADGSWQLAPVTVISPDGRAEISGTIGDELALRARFDRIGLSLATLINPALDISGRLSGNIDFSFPRDAALPTGRANLRIDGLSRAGVGNAGSRVDLGINAVIAGGKASARMLIAREGRIEGRAQAQLLVIPGGRSDPLLTRLVAAPLFAQLRWSGPAQAFWQLAGIDAVDVRGPVTISVDGSGVLGDPSFSGTLTAAGARVESTAIGLVFDKIAMESRFKGSRLDIIRFSAAAGKAGTISGSGGIDLSAVRNFPLDIQLALKNALIVNRDDLQGTATGDVHIQNDGDGARITGKLAINRARINIGSSSVADVPVLTVREIHRDAAPRVVQRLAKPTAWRLDLDLEAERRLEVHGLGLESEWSGNLKVTGQANAPRITGKIQLVRGDYDFAGKRFALTKGDIRFSGNSPPDPAITITAENTSSSFTAKLSVTGTALRPVIAFSSNPALPEDEVLSRVLFGNSITSLSAPEALQLAGALASLRGGSNALNPINAVRKGLGIDRLRILPADIVKRRKTSVAAGQYIGDRVYIEVTSDAQGYNATSVEISLTRALSILSEIATFGGTSVSLRWKRDY